MRLREFIAWLAAGTAVVFASVIAGTAKYWEPEKVTTTVTKTQKIQRTMKPLQVAWALNQLVIANETVDPAGIRCVYYSPVTPDKLDQQTWGLTLCFRDGR